MPKAHQSNTLFCYVLFRFNTLAWVSMAGRWEDEVKLLNVQDLGHRMFKDGFGTGTLTPFLCCLMFFGLMMFPGLSLSLYIPLLF